MNNQIDDFKKHLEATGKSANTIRSYCKSVESFLSFSTEITSEAVQLWISALRLSCSPTTVNLRINGLNAYIRFKGSPIPAAPVIKVQRKSYVERVLSHSDYIYLKRRLATDGHMMLHFAVWAMCASGARISELLQVQVADFFCGHFDVCSKGGKTRRLYFPRPLCEAALRWLADEGRSRGPVFLNARSSLITARGLAREIKARATAYGLQPAEVHPHAFRHRFAINFLSRHNDLALLADIMGHSSIETTRIYLRRSAEEQRRFLDSIVDW